MPDSSGFRPNPMHRHLLLVFIVGAHATCAVAQTNAMDPALRARVLDQYPDADFVSEWDITDVG